MPARKAFISTSTHLEFAHLSICMLRSSNSSMVDMDTNLGKHLVDQLVAYSYVSEQVNAGLNLCDNHILYHWPNCVSSPPILHTYLDHSCECYSNDNSNHKIDHLHALRSRFTIMSSPTSVSSKVNIYLM